MPTHRALAQNLGTSTIKELSEIKDLEHQTAENQAS